MTGDFLITAGDVVKSLGRNRVAGRVVTFSTSRDPDRVRDYFDENTDFWLRGPGERRPILFNHGLDRALKRRRFGDVELTRATDGVWAEGSIKESDDDSRKILDLVDRGELRWSTGSVAHLVAKTKRESAYHVDEWPIAECSLTPKDLAAEPRCIASLKSLIASSFDALLTPNRSAEQRAAQIYAECLMRGHEMRMAEFERSIHSDDAAEMAAYYNALADLKIARINSIVRNVKT